MPGVTQTGVGASRVVASVVLFVLLLLTLLIWAGWDLVLPILEAEDLLLGDGGINWEALLGDEIIIGPLVFVGIGFVFLFIVVRGVMNGFERLNTLKGIVETSLNTPNQTMSTAHPQANKKTAINNELTSESAKRVVKYVEDFFQKNKKNKDGSEKKNHWVGVLIVLYFIGNILLAILGSVFD